jgi:hypothetical protein
MAWHRKYQPMAVGYEQYGMMADIEHIRDLQERENYRFDIHAAGRDDGEERSHSPA